MHGLKILFAVGVGLFYAGGAFAQSKGCHYYSNQVSSLREQIKFQEKSLGIHLDSTLYYSGGEGCSPNGFYTYQSDFLSANDSINQMRVMLQALRIYTILKKYRSRSSDANEAEGFMSNLLPVVRITTQRRPGLSPQSLGFYRVETATIILQNRVGAVRAVRLTPAQVLNAYLDTVSVDPDHLLSKRLVVAIPALRRNGLRGL